MKKMIKMLASVALCVSFTGCAGKNSSAASTAESIVDLTKEEAEELIPTYGDGYGDIINADEFEKLDNSAIEELLETGDTVKFLRMTTSGSTDNVTMYKDHSMLFNSGDSACWTVVSGEVRISSLQGSCEVSSSSKYGVSYEIYHLSANAYIFRALVSGSKQLDEPVCELWVTSTGDNVTYG